MKLENIKYWGCTTDKNDNESDHLFKILGDNGKITGFITLEQIIAKEIQTAVQKERSYLISYLKKMLSNKMNDIVFSNWKAPIYALIGYLESTTKDTKDVV